MKRFSLYTKSGTIRNASVAPYVPDGKGKTPAAWRSDRIKEIRQMFLQMDRNDRLAFKEHQEKIMASILSGNDTFVILPTGGGKSLCFQAPSVFFAGITLVITPLVALIEDQVDNFNKNHYPIHHLKKERNYYENIRFQAIYPGMDGLSIQEMFSEIRNPSRKSNDEYDIRYKFLYVSPERLSNPKFLRALGDAEKQGLEISHIVIDEVHCMSQWGFEFRESYLNIPGFIDQRPIRPILSVFTATATPRDVAEIKNILRFPTDEKEYQNKQYTEEFHAEKRENLHLHIIKCSDYSSARTDSLKSRMETLLELFLEKENYTKVCIIYRTTAVGVDELCQTLEGNELLKDRVVKYHAQMSKSARNDSIKAFMRSGASSESCKNIMIATKAFGMGIDKRDISLVIHYDVPRSLEDYYQEVGRAGRDGRTRADCYLLYSSGPKRERGTLQYTINWITSGKETSKSGCMPISSQFSDKMKENIYYWSYYRLCYVMKYCNMIKGSDSAHDFLGQYLENRFAREDVIRDLDFFYGYIDRYYPIAPDEKERFRKRLFTGADPDRFPGSYSAQGRQENDILHSEIRQLAGEVNELHINNTFLANRLRHHPEAYRLNEPYVLSQESPGSGQKWRAASPDRPHELTFTLHGSEKLSYFDMCVLDAIYSIERLQKKSVYVQTVWEILTGRTGEYSSQDKRELRTAIQNSIDKMRATSISISDNQCGIEIKEEVFLPLTDKPKEGQKGYTYSAIPPLFLYAEEMNGEIIRVPVSLFDGARIRRDTILLKKDFSTELSYGGEEEDSPGKNRCVLGCDRIPAYLYSFSPSADNVALYHYLIHRIAIYKNRRREKFILFDTIKEITKIREDSDFFCKKTAAILDHYKNIGYLSQYYLRISDYIYRLDDGSQVVDNAYFRVDTTPVARYRLCNGTCSLILSADFALAWSSEHNECLMGHSPNFKIRTGLVDAVREGRSLSPDTQRALANVAVGSVDGIVLQCDSDLE